MGIKDDLSFAGVIILGFSVAIAVCIGIIYGVVTVAKWAWGG